MDFWDIIYKIGFAICHQLSHRTPVISGLHLPLCARCTGIYLGVVCGYLYILIRGKWRSGDLPNPPYGFILAGFICLTFIDGFTTFLKLRPESEYLRVLTGLFTGSALPTFAYPLLIGEITDKTSDKPLMGSWIDLTVFIILLFIIFGIYCVSPPGSFYIISILSIIGVILIFSNLFGMLIAMMIKPQKAIEYIFTSLITFIAMYLFLLLLYHLHRYALKFINPQS